MRSSTKIAIGFVGVLVAAYAGYNAWAVYELGRTNFAPLQPGVVNLVAITRGAGYRIVVANEIAQLVEGDAPQFGAPQSRTDTTSEVGSGKRIPIDDMLGSLRGDPASLGRLVMRLNDLKSDAIPTDAVRWNMADVQRALAGDSGLRARLVKDLNVSLDGRPMPYIRPAALERGIVIECPVQVPVRLGASVRKLQALIRQPFKAQLLKDLEARFARVEAGKEQLVGYYRELAQQALDEPAKRENVARVLAELTSPRRLDGLASAPARILSNATIVVTQDQIAGSSFDSYETTDGKIALDVNIDLTNEGRLRLWKYSRGRTGFQLLFIVDGVAIAAPIIRQELATRRVTIKNMSNEKLVRKAVAVMNEANANK